MADHFDALFGDYACGIAVMEEVSASLDKQAASVTPFSIVITADQRHRHGASFEVRKCGWAAFRSMHRIAEPDHFLRPILADQRVEILLQLGIAPSGQEVAACAMSGCVTPVQISDNQ